MSAPQVPETRPVDRGRITVEEAERLLPRSEYVRCYRELARRGCCRYDPKTPYADLPGICLKHAKRIGLLVGLHAAFADVRRGCTLWDI